MAQTQQIDLVINKMTQAQYATITPVETELYFITDEPNITSSEITTALGYTPVNPSSLSTVATTGSYSDLSNLPTIGTADTTIKLNGTAIGTINANATSASAINVSVSLTATYTTATQTLTISLT